MKRLVRWFGCLLVFAGLLFYFAPKRLMWYQAEALLEPFGVVLSGERAIDGGLSLRMEGGTLYYEDLSAAVLSETTLRPWGFYTALEMAPFTLNEGMHTFLPGDIERVSVVHSLLHPTTVVLEASGDFGQLSAQANLVERKVTATLTPSAALTGLRPFWLRQLKKNTSGDYGYEAAF